MDNNNMSLRQKVRNFKVLSFDAMTILEEEKEKIEAIETDDNEEVQQELQEIWNYLNTAERCFLDGARVFELATKKKQKIMSLIQGKSTLPTENSNDNGINPPIVVEEENRIEDNNSELVADSNSETPDEFKGNTDDDHITEVPISNDNPIEVESTSNETTNNNDSEETEISAEEEIESNSETESESTMSPVEAEPSSITEDTTNIEKEPEISEISTEKNDNQDNSEIIKTEEENKDESVTEATEDTTNIEKEPEISEISTEKNDNQDNSEIIKTEEANNDESVTEATEDTTNIEKEDTSTLNLVTEKPTEEKTSELILPTVELPIVDDNKDTLTTNTEKVEESKSILPLEEEPTLEVTGTVITDNSDSVVLPFESNKPTEESTEILPTINENQNIDNTEQSETSVISFEKTTNEADKAILVSQEQAKKLRASKEKQESLFNTINSTSHENELTLEQQVEEMLSQLPILYGQGKTKEAEELSEKISVLNKKITQKAA